MGSLHLQLWTRIGAMNLTELRPFAPRRSMTAQHSDAPARVARWGDWFRPATRVSIGEPFDFPLERFVQKRKADRLCQALEGTWKDEHLFALRQAYELWQFYQKKIAECDVAIETVLKELAGPEDPTQPAPPPASKRGGVNAPQIAGLHGLLWRLCGQKDPTQLPGVADHVLLQLLGEVGTDLGGPGKTKSSSPRGWVWRRAVGRAANGAPARSGGATGPADSSA
jgi:hypothetical protein